MRSAYSPHQEATVGATQTQPNYVRVVSESKRRPLAAPTGFKRCERALLGQNGRINENAGRPEEPA